MSSYNFSTPFTTLPYNLVKGKITELIEQTFNRVGSLYVACNEKRVFFFLLNNLKDLNCGHNRKFVTLFIIFWTIYLYDLAQNCIYKS